jgi:hypothetical protein
VVARAAQTLAAVMTGAVLAAEQQASEPPDLREGVIASRRHYALGWQVFLSLRAGRLAAITVGTLKRLVQSSVTIASKTLGVPSEDAAIRRRLRAAMDYDTKCQYIGHTVQDPKRVFEGICRLAAEDISGHASTHTDHAAFLGSAIESLEEYRLAFVAAKRDGLR